MSEGDGEAYTAFTKLQIAFHQMPAIWKSHGSVSQISKTIRLLLIVLLVPVVPFAVFGWWLEPQLATYSESLTTTQSVTVAVVTLLAADIFLPIPSSVVCTVAGQQLGLALGTASSAIGLTLGNLIGFGVARRWGRKMAIRYAGEESLRKMDDWQSAYGTTFLVLSRPLPIFAEAAVLLSGMNRLAFSRFFPPVAACNVALCAAYAALGMYSSSHQWFPAALVIAAGLPLLLAESARRRWKS